MKSELEDQVSNTAKIPLMSHRQKMVTSCAIWFGTVTLGLCNGVLGPALVQFSIKFDTDVATVSKLFTIQMVSCLIGALGAGVIFKYINRQLATVGLVMVMGISNILLPLVPTLPIFFALTFVSGLAWAGYDLSQTVWMIELWEGQAAAFIQTQHFSYALGAFISPIIVKYCLPEDLDEEMSLNLNSTDPVIYQRNRNSTHPVIYQRNRNSSDPVMDLDPPKPGLAPLLWLPFSIAGTVSIISGLFIFVLYNIKKYEKSRVRVRGHQGAVDSKRSKLLVKSIIIILSCLFLGFYVGTEAIAFQFLPTFSHFIDLGLSQREGASVLSALAAAFTIGRGVGIVIVLRVLPEILLTFNVFIILTGNCLLLFSNTSTLALYVGALLLGFGFSTVYAGFFGFIEKHTEVGNFVGAMLIAFGSLICSIYPLFVGSFIEQTPFILVNTNFFSICAAAITFLLIVALVRRLRNEDDKDDCWIPILCNSETVIETL